MAAGATYEPIATTTLGSATSSITFSSIASSWTDLRVVFTFKSATGAALVALRFNNDSNTNYSITYLRGDGASAISGRYSNENNIGNQASSAAANTWSNIIYDIFSYAGSTYKTCLYTKNLDANGSGFVNKEVGLWRNTAAITRLDLISGANIFDVGTTATLYGIKAA